MGLEPRQYGARWGAGAVPAPHAAPYPRKKILLALLLLADLLAARAQRVISRYAGKAPGSES